MPPGLVLCPILELTDYKLFKTTIARKYLVTFLMCFVLPHRSPGTRGVTVQCGEARGQVQASGEDLLLYPLKGTNTLSSPAGRQRTRQESALCLHLHDLLGQSQAAGGREG
jgi:hypothetical protein